MTRDLDTEDASAGFDAMLERCLPALAEVTSLLRSGTAHDPVTIPWQGWSRRQDDYLLTRLVEIVVHSTTWPTRSVRRSLNSRPRHTIPCCTCWRTGPPNGTASPPSSAP
ncbi:hypothetical protein [Nostocoides australiense]